MDIFRKIFGLNEENEHTHNQHPHNPEINEFLNNSDESDDPVFRRSFDVFTDTLQMQQYFEQEINDILKRFGFQGFREFSTSDTPNISSFGSNPFEREGTSQNLRDQFLKPGYIKPKTSSDLIDKDLDEKVKTGNFDSLVDEKSENTVIPYKPSLPRMEFSSLGFSESFKSVSKPDGRQN
ncbi:unnamed protein product [Psylliodes chrysocephalus]|uniref:Uncharacterized protein n=1 Tax=Psylliodes chrysocephalus TaxID=3402493 RepID=A0A9P0CWM3_9CUCU|nr:unnamed protein product [Psylliodes chrysocephala]